MPRRNEKGRKVHRGSSSAAALEALGYIGKRQKVRARHRGVLAGWKWDAAAQRPSGT